MAVSDSPGGDDGQSEVEAARDELQGAVPEAARTVRDLLEADDERVQLKAAEAVLDRAGLTKADKSSTGKAKRQVGGASKEGPLDDLM
jgi:hypothetical protein